MSVLSRKLQVREGVGIEPFPVATYVVGRQTTSKRVANTVYPLSSSTKRAADQLLRTQYLGYQGFPDPPGMAAQPQPSRDRGVPPCGHSGQETLARLSTRTLGARNDNIEPLVRRAP